MKKSTLLWVALVLAVGAGAYLKFKSPQTASPVSAQEPQGADEYAEGAQEPREPLEQPPVEPGYEDEYDPLYPPAAAPQRAPHNENDHLETSRAAPYEGHGYGQPMGQMPPAPPVPKDSESFNTLGDRVLADLANVGEHDQEGLMQSAARLESLAQAVIEHPNLKPDAIKFYTKGLENRDFPAPVRALFLSNLQEIAPDAGAKMAATVEPEVNALAADDDDF